MRTPAHDPALARRLRRTAAICASVVVGMIGLAYAAVPLYDLFCRVTGFDGTPVVGSGPAGQVLDRTVKVRFDANVAPGLNWRFSAETAEVKVKLGQTTIVLYRVTNDGPLPTTGIATFNVQPALAGAYFIKLECFCFTEQTIQPGETKESAVVFYVDPSLAQDPNVTSLNSITLSYTYFPAKGGRPAADAALPASRKAAVETTASITSSGKPSDPGGLPAMSGGPVAAAAPAETDGGALPASGPATPTPARRP